MGAGRIVVRLDVMLARRKMTGRELAREVGFSEQKISLPRAGRVRGIRFETLARICGVLDFTRGNLLEVEAAGNGDRLKQPRVVTIAFLPRSLNVAAWVSCNGLSLYRFWK